MTTKEIVLAFLLNHSNESFSGQKLADHLNISRNAIWKAIQTLRDEGYPIESVPGVGYRLSGQVDVLHSNVIESHLGIPLDVTSFSSLDSTNTEAKRKLNNGVDADFLIVAEEQTKGKGRLGRTFYSPAENGLYMSLALHNLNPDADTTLITTLAAVAVCQAIEELTDEKPQIKWVNDIFLNGKKICGILTEGIINLETQSIQSIILGIGLNVNLDESGIPEELKPIIGSLFEKKEQSASRNEIAAKIIQHFYRLYETMSSKLFLDEYRKRCFVLGKDVTFVLQKKHYEGRAIAIDDKGGLVVKLPDHSEKTLSYGEISIKMKADESE